MKLTMLLLASSVALSHAQMINPQPVMTNQTVEAMVHGGVSLPTIIQAIKTAPEADFVINDHEFTRLVQAGASDRAGDQIVEAMHQRAITRPVRQESIAPTATVAAVPVQPEPTIPMEKPTVPVENSTVPVANLPTSVPFSHSGKKRVFVGESDTYYSSSFYTSSASAFATSRYAKGSARGFGFSSAGMQRLAINVMKALHDNCPAMDVTNDVETADYFLRMDRDAPFGPAKMAIFDRSRTMIFVTSTHSISKDVKRFCKQP